MESLKNIFDYATKELSQDAFLAWLIDNYNCDEECVREASLGLLKLFGVDVDGIVEIKIKKQLSAKTEAKANKNKIDIAVLIDCIKMNQALFIEDKTESSEHDNQLPNYDKIIQEEYENKGYRPIKIYYKTSRLTLEEREKIDEADHWRIIEMKEIRDFWKKYENASNLILCQYAQRISKITHDYYCCDRPQDDDPISRWKDYFCNAFGNKANELGFDSDVDSKDSKQRYVYAKFRLHGYGTGYPYLEIRSDEFISKYFIARILTHKFDENKYPGMIDRLENHLKKKSYQLFKKCNLDKTKAKTGKIIYKSEQEYNNFFIDALKEYKEIMESVTE